ncbi:hypothetical protein P171DRAFT_484584 [Karstenula rhodostoma CBS 690.94]|uniref:Uncharacterized protein n=1 Tax=Karstenula rhodostoma CBS 690.94 TaxID=1392251 RepID=A0A9P4UE76_9PLEO|nr:hypothetical protein P171DRAFT_484584 [Karstenula rhodostoma CBS 690.94]
MRHEATVANSSSRLLSLPGELRNKIFKYALTADDGIIYAYHFLGADHLYLYPRRPGHQTEGDLTRFSGPVLFNRLKHVCKQIQEEVKDVELKYNTVDYPYYADEEHRYPDDFIRLLRSYPQQYSWLTSLRLHTTPNILFGRRSGHRHDGFADIGAYLAPLVQFYKTIPHIKIHMVIANWMSDPTSLANVALGSSIVAACGLDAMTNALFNHPCYSMWGANKIFCTELIKEREKSGLAGACDGLDNLTFFPDMTDEEVEHMETTQGEQFVSRLPPQHPTLPHYEEWKKVWARMAVSWARHGIKPFQDEGSWTP